MQHKRFHHWLMFVILGLVGVGQSPQWSAAADDAKSAAKSKPRANRLAKETSPYLLLHAHNPVDWYPWGPEPFEKAKQENKLIFLSVGYSSCYWCHVMERLVFSNEAIAKTMNQDFVCIKVDREERPDVDDIYMTALQVYYQAIGAPSGGGWPLSMFLTPDAKPVAGGTYFPPENTAGSQGFPTVLTNVSDMWKNKREQSLKNADVLTTEVKRLMQPKLSLEPVAINQKLANLTFVGIVGSFDSDYGGVDFNPNRPDGPKFPTPAKLAEVQHYLERLPNPEVTRLLDLTLQQMASGGIRDHVGGGFHRYSVDRRWDVPHFEKMLYDQAQLVTVYSTAYQTTQRPLYKQVAEEILEFVRRELTSPDGGFYSAIDAETNGAEGEFYVWDASEIDDILGASAAAFKQAYRVKELPDFEHGNVLRLSVRRQQNSDTTKAGAQQDEFAASRKKLLEARGKRQRPLLDDKILTDWNGLMIGAYARAGVAFENPEYTRVAEKAADFVLANLRDSQGRLLHAYSAGQARLTAYLDDYAFFVDGLLALHDATQQPKWLNAAKKMQDDQLRLFLDENQGGFFFTSHQHEALLARTKTCYDGVVPAGNSVSARNLIKLSAQTGTSTYLDEARATIEAFAPQLKQTPRGCANLAMAITELLEAAPEDAQAEPSNDNQVVTASAKDDADDKKEPLIILADQKEEKKKKDEHVKARAYLSTDKLPAGGTCQFIVVLNIDQSWHINANPPQPDYMKPTVVEFKSKNEVQLIDVAYPAGHGFSFPGEPTPVMVYEGEVAIRGTLKVPEKAAGKPDDMEITIQYQACNDKGCLPPKSITLTGKLDVAKRGEAVKSINARLFAPAKNAQNEKK